MPVCDDEHLKAEKFRGTHRRGLQLTLADGTPAWADQIDISHTYLGVIDGLPGPDFIERSIREAKDFVQDRFHGPEPVIIAPRCFDPGSVHPIIPPLRFTAQIVSWRLLEPRACGSWLNLVWFAEIDDQKPLVDFVTEALARVDWATQSSSFDI